MFLLQGIWKGMKWLGGVIVAPLKKLRSMHGIGRIVRCAVHALAVLLVVGALLWVNYFFRLDTALRTPLPILRMVWLPLLFLLSYSLCWLGWYVCRFIAADEETSPYPDIDKAWQQAMNSITQAGVDVATAPLYLLVGRPRGRTHDLIRAAGIPLATAPVPNQDDAPLQVFANREGIYVSCANVSLLGRQAEMFAELGDELSVDEDYQPHEAEDADVKLEEIPFDAPNSGPPNPHVSTATLPAGATVTQSALAEVEQHVAMLVDEHEPAESEFALDADQSTELDPLAAALDGALLKDAGEVEEITARLRHLCRLIVDERRPNVPVNGVLVLAPALATDGEEAANHVGVLAEQDLQTISEMTQVQCPHVVLLCDLETTPGGVELLSRFPQEQRARRLGVRFPEIAPCDATEAGEMIDEGVKWLCDGLLPPLVYRLVSSSQPEQNEEGEVLRSNVALYRFLYCMRRRRERLAHLLRRALCRTQFQSVLHGSQNLTTTSCVTACYLVASGEDSQRQQGFAEAVFAQLPQLTNSLAWTDEILRRDRRQRLLAKAGYVALGSLAAAMLIAAFVF